MEWHMNDGHPDIGIGDDQGRLVAMVTTDEDNPQEREEVVRNAVLIAAAPDLLRACREFEEAMAGCGDLATAVDTALLAIAKAEGRSE